MDYTKLSILELSKLLQEKIITSEEVVRQVLNKINETKNLNTLINTLDEYAIKKAKETDIARAKGEKLGVLAGVPITIKDNISLLGFKTTAGSKYLENYVSPYSATLVKNLEDQGAIIIGKNNLDDFAMGSSTEYSYFGKTLNPINKQYSPGGSSGGSAASVASNQSFASIGTDTGGSIRQPASFCGVVGLKPTYGSVSRFGVVAFASSLDQAGPMTKTVKDNAIVFSVIAKHDKNDSMSIETKETDYLKEIDNFSLFGKKIGVIKELKNSKMSESVKQSYEKALEFYKQNGAKIVDVSVENIANSLSCYHIISSAEAASNFARFDGIKYGVRGEGYEDLIDLYYKTRTQCFGKEVKKRIMLGNFVISTENLDKYFTKAKKVQSKITEQFNKVFEECDVVLTPTTSTSAFKVGENNKKSTDMYEEDIFTVPASLAGLPALSVPFGKDKQTQMPIGLQFVGRKHSEAVLFGFANYLEENAKISEAK